ncbi:hypothetical protein NT6N_13730 [Oceaniferula spumae]|uniref:Verru_Chthon cassette protein A n=1 Tax=Oceaniferula spumae TaxID=2979115 RepID=A0AAT9FK38_9BACT
MKIQLTHISFRGTPHNSPGFSLIATVSVMTLLVLVALTMLSLSTLEIRQSQQDLHKETARANARMALMLAIGRLQQSAGPDQRVTARADILEGVDDNLELDSSKRWLTGVWNTAEWDPLNPNDKKFVDWLVSGSDGVGRHHKDYVFTPSGELVVPLVGQQSVDDQSGQVSVAKVPLSENGNNSGALAYAVFDNGVKASAANSGKAAGAERDLASRLAAYPRTALEVTDINELQNASDNETADRTLSDESLDLLFPSAGNIVSDKAFHDITHLSRMLLTDVRNGGLKKDLSSAFELDLEAFNALDEFHMSGERNVTNFYSWLSDAYSDAKFYDGDKSPDLGYIFEAPAPNNSNLRMRGPTWDMMRNHYRQYKREYENMSWARQMRNLPNDVFAARGEMPLSYATRRGSSPGTFALHVAHGDLYSKGVNRAYAANCVLPLAREHGAKTHGTVPRTIGLVVQPTSPKIAPTVLRYTLVLGAVMRKVNGEDTMAISFDPYITIFNPYNVAIAFDSFGMFHSKMNPCRVTIDYTNQEGNSDRAVVDFSNNYFTQGTVSYRLRQESKPYVLEPGEVKVISPYRLNPGDEAEIVRSHDINPLDGRFEYNEASGIVVAPGKTVRPKEGTQVTMELRGKVRPNRVELEHLTFNLFSRYDHQGGERDIRKHLPPLRGIQADTDIFDDMFVGRTGFYAQDFWAFPNLRASRTVNESQIPSLNEDGLFVGALDLRMKHANEANGEKVSPFADFNYLYTAVDPRDYEARSRMAPSWKVELKQITDISELQLVQDTSGHGLWGAATTLPAGSSHIILNEVPRLPMTSLAQYQHLTAGLPNSGGAKHLGNSFTHPGIDALDQVVRKRPLQIYFFIDNQWQVDNSWAGNEGLWDRYFFSGLFYGDMQMPWQEARVAASLDEAIESTMLGDDYPLFNPYMRYTPSGRSDERDRMISYEHIAESLVIENGFNINSTSEAAWRAVLGGMRNLEYPWMDKNQLKSANGSEYHVVGRYGLPGAEAQSPWTGFRALSDQEIEALAKAIVKQVKLRGPFMGLADFVNRRLTNDEIDGYDVGKLGALQMAIEAAGLNDDVRYSENVDYQPTIYSNNPGIENKRIALGGKSIERSTMRGAPQYLMQADILTGIGGRISARSDTFTIRTYGESYDKTGQVMAKAWCEAVVQRTSEWLEPTDEQATEKSDDYGSSNISQPTVPFWQANDAMPELNKKFGRRFKVVSFRWLEPQTYQD